MKVNAKLINALRTGIIAVSAGSICFGILRGEMAEVLAKSIRICLECIGIG